MGVSPRKQQSQPRGGKGEQSIPPSNSYFQCRKLLFLVAGSFAHRPNSEIHDMTTLITVIRQLARLFDGGWLPLAILGVVVFWMVHSA